MCGIAAIISPNPKPLSFDILQMANAIRHRGPDGEGFALISAGRDPRFFSGADTVHESWSFEIPYRPTAEISKAGDLLSHVAFGHRRLSILDLSQTGHQPMFRPEPGLVITYNGEIYNYLELRAELEKRGHRFSTGTDTEVLLCAYEEWGPDCLHRFNGMFAFVLYDLKRNQVFAARDRFGVKPLYFWRSPDGVVAFASEIKQFTVLPGWSAKLQHQRAYEYLNFGLTDHTEETLFSGVRQVRGGEMITLSMADACGEIRPVRWYELKPTAVRFDYAEAVDYFRELFFDAVRLRLRSDVPVGTALSGGLDSSSIVCAVHHLLNHSSKKDFQNTFSACSKIKRFDESRFINSVVQKTNVKPHYTQPSLSELFLELEKIIWHHDEPFASTSVFAEWKVFELVAQTDVKVTLDGHGADEMLAGYHGYFIPFYMNLLLRGQFFTLARELQAARRNHGRANHHLAQALFRLLVPAPARSFVKKLVSHGVSHTDWLNGNVLKSNATNPFETYGGMARSIREFSYDQMLHSSLPKQLKWADRDSMAHSIESRAPFLDYRLVEFLLGCPDSFKIASGTTKRILRGAMRGFLPELVENRPDKMGFVTPEEHWVQNEAPAQFLEEARRTIDSSHEVFTSTALEQIEAVVSGKKTFNHQPWRIIAFGAWMKRFSVGV